MEQKILEELQDLLCDINPVEISSHFADDTLFSWLGAWRSRAEMLVAYLVARAKSKIDHVHAVGACYCREREYQSKSPFGCSLHEIDFTDDSFLDGFCSYGKITEVQNNGN